MLLNLHHEASEKTILTSFPSLKSLCSNSADAGPGRLPQDFVLDELVVLLVVGEAYDDQSAVGNDRVRPVVLLVGATRIHLPGQGTGERARCGPHHRKVLDLVLAVVRRVLAGVGAGGSTHIASGRTEDGHDGDTQRHRRSLHGVPRDCVPRGPGRVDRPLGPARQLALDVVALGVAEPAHALDPHGGARRESNRSAPEKCLPRFRLPDVHIRMHLPYAATQKGRSGLSTLSLPAGASASGGRLLELVAGEEGVPHVLVDARDLGEDLGSRVDGDTGSQGVDAHARDQVEALGADPLALVIAGGWQGHPYVTSSRWSRARPRRRRRPCRRFSPGLPCRVPQ